MLSIFSHFYLLYVYVCSLMEYLFIFYLFESKLFDRKNGIFKKILIITIISD